MIEKLMPIQQAIEKGLQNLGFDAAPQTLYQPANYILMLGGKRLRPALTLLACGLYADAEKALPQALAIEVFHNFTLMHDDIMDQAPLRRGQQTVHEKWNLSTAVLSGDAMLVRAYQLMAEADTKILPQLLQVFSKTAMQVCEGQQFDMDYQTQEVVSEADYIYMIQLKTSVLLGAALEIGATVGGAQTEDAQHLYQFGLLLGTSFQIKDDLLDVFGNPEKVGKQVGGDILANKKTLLLLHAMHTAKNEDATELHMWLAKDGSEKVAAITQLYQKLGVVDYAENRALEFYNRALGHLDALQVADDKKEILHQFARWLMERQH